MDLCAVGDLNRLIVLPVPRLSRSGEMRQVSRIQQLPGNDATIVSLQAARLGRTSCLLATNTIALRDGQPLIKTGVACTPAAFFLEHLSLDERTGLAEAYPFRCALAPARLPRCRVV